MAHFKYTAPKPHEHFKVFRHVPSRSGKTFSHIESVSYRMSRSYALKVAEFQGIICGWRVEAVDMQTGTVIAEYRDGAKLPKKCLRATLPEYWGAIENRERREWRNLFENNNEMERPKA